MINFFALKASVSHPSERPSPITHPRNPTVSQIFLSNKLTRAIYSYQTTPIKKKFTRSHKGTIVHWYAVCIHSEGKNPGKNPHRRKIWATRRKYFLCWSTKERIWFLYWDEMCFSFFHFFFSRILWSCANCLIADKKVEQSKTHHIAMWSPYK